MARKSPFPLKPHLFVLVHAGDGVPYAARLNMRRIARVVILGGFTFGLSVCGTLLFFRELELNRKLQDRLLELETHERLALLAPSAPMPRLVATSPVGEPAAPVPSAESMPRTAKGDTEGKDAAAESESEKVNFSAVAARIADVSAECQAQDCVVKLSMVPVSPGHAAGQVVVVLETEVPRIGAGNPTTQVRKRFYIYPGNEVRDDMPETDIPQLARKNFRFSRALQTTATFTVGKLLRPLAANIYLYDRKGTLVRHERKVIETEE